MSNQSRFYYTHADARGDDWHNEPGCSDTINTLCGFDCDCECHSRYSTLTMTEEFIAHELGLPRRK